MNSKKMKTIGIAVFIIWILTVFIPHFFKKANIVLKDNIIFKDIRLTEYDGSKKIKFITAKSYDKDLKNGTGKFEKINAKLYTDSGEVNVIADRGNEQDRTSTYILEKNVRVNTKDSSLYTDKLVYREGIKQVISPGRIEIHQKDKITTGDFMEYYINNKTWKIRGNVKNEIFRNHLK